MIYKTMQAFHFILISHKQHFVALTLQAIFQQQLSNKYKWRTREFNKTTSSSKQDNAKSESLLEKQTVTRNTQQDISEAKEYSNEKAERASLPHK